MPPAQVRFAAGASQAPTLHAARAELAAAEWRREAARQGLAGSKLAEDVAVLGAGEEHRRHLSAASAGKKQLLDEMRAVRDRVHSQLRSQQRQGRVEAEVANRELVNAGKRAMDARAEAERWHAKAAETEAQRRATWVRTETHLERHRRAHEDRVDDASRHAASRELHGQTLREEAGLAFKDFYSRHDEHCATQEHHATQSLRLKEQSSLLSERANMDKVRATKNQVARAAVQQAREVREAQEAAASKHALAKQELADRHKQCRDTLAQERVCASQAQRIAAEQREVQEADYHVHRGKLEAKLQLATAHLQKGDVLPKERMEVAADRNEAWEARNRRKVEAAQRRADEEEVLAEERVRRAKISLTELQASCVARINELLEQWHAARRVDEAKVRAAQARTDAVLCCCQEQRERQEAHHAGRFDQTRGLAERSVATQEEKVKALAELSEQRVAMMQRQSRERRRMAEQRLEELQQHIEDVRGRCAERVRLEREAAEEKLEIVRRRVAEATARAESRAAEAEADRDTARAAMDEVAARCRGAAAEARRRGLLDIAQSLELRSSSEPPSMEVDCDAWIPLCGGTRGATASTAAPGMPAMQQTGSSFV